MKKILEYLKQKNRWAIVLVIVLLLFGVLVEKFQQKKIDKLKEKNQTEIKLRNALIDSINYYQNNEHQLVAEKLTIQLKINDLEKIKNQLTVEQNKLINKINEINKKNAIITAALIHANFTIDSLVHVGNVIIDTTNKIIEFIETKNPDINYDIKAINVLPYPSDIKPKLMINNLFLPNEQFIEFHWEKDKKNGYPIAFSITNSNKYMKISDINSYAIPELQKQIVNPNGWQKISQWFIKNGKIVKYVGGGIIIGATGTYVLMK